MPSNKESLRGIAERLGLNYYDHFGVCTLNDLHFPMAKVYERGRWRWIVVGGRPYHDKSVARSMVDDARVAQRMCLKAVDPIDTERKYDLPGLHNPIDKWEYKLEQF